MFYLGEYGDASDKIQLIFYGVGEFKYNKIKIYAVPMDDYEKDIENLRKSNFEVADYGNGYLNGKVNAENKGILQFSTMYDKGWKVYVDGEKVDTMKVNKYFLGIEIDEGEHEVILKYRTPYLFLGLGISILGIIAFWVICIKKVGKIGGINKRYERSGYKKLNRKME